MGRYFDDYLFHSSEEIELEESNELEDYQRYWDDSLCHFGIAGMHWGKRRYQNPDGSYTEAGMMRRYGHGHLGEGERRGSNGEHNSGGKSKKKGLSTAAKLALVGAGAVGLGVAAANIHGYGKGETMQNLRNAGSKVKGVYDKAAAKAEEVSDKAYNAYVNSEAGKRTAQKLREKALNEESKGWHKYQEEQLEKEWRERMAEQSQLQSEWEKSRKTNKVGDLGDEELNDLRKRAQTLATEAGRKYDAYAQKNPERLKDKINSADDKYMIDRELHKTKKGVSDATKELLKGSKVRAAEKQQKLYGEKQKQKQLAEDDAAVAKKLGRAQKITYTEKGQTYTEKGLSNKSKWNPETESAYNEKRRKAEKAYNDANEAYQKSKKTEVYNGSRLTTRGDSDLKAKADAAQKTLKEASNEYYNYHESNPAVKYQRKEQAKANKKKYKNG